MAEFNHNQDICELCEAVVCIHCEGFDLSKHVCNTARASLDLLKKVFDVATSSLDFGSGMLDDAEQEALRGLAVLIGVDPSKGTQSNMRCKYRGRDAGAPGPIHDWNDWYTHERLIHGESVTVRDRFCKCCAMRETDPPPQPLDALAHMGRMDACLG